MMVWMLMLTTTMTLMMMITNDANDDHDYDRDSNKPVFAGELIHVYFAVDPCHGRGAADWLRGSAPYWEDAGRHG